MPWCRTYDASANPPHVAQRQLPTCSPATHNPQPCCDATRSAATAGTSWMMRVRQLLTSTSFEFVFGNFPRISQLRTTPHAHRTMYSIRFTMLIGCSLDADLMSNSRLQALRPVRRSWQPLASVSSSGDAPSRSPARAAASSWTPPSTMGASAPPRATLPSPTARSASTAPASTASTA